MDKPKKGWRVGDGTPGPGRPKGSRHKRSERLTKALKEEGYDPQSLVRLGFEIARNPKTKPDTRIHAIGTVLPYMLPKLSSVEVSGGDGKTPLKIRIVRDEGQKAKRGGSETVKP